ncbi:MAG: type II toxin-antitoxin system PemK/MazF family toxin [Gemmataceae bacterium]
MKLRRGDIVLLAFPFADGKGSKVRPAIVVQCDANNDRLRNTIVAMITSTTDRAAREPTQLLIDIATQAGKHTGLLHTSAIKCENVFTVEQSRIARTLGNLPETMMSRVDACLRAALAL